LLVASGVAQFGPAPHSLGGVRAKIARHRNQLFVKAEKLRELLSSQGTKRILFSGNPQWTEDIKRGFQRLPHEVEFGPISEDSFERFDIVVPLSLSALKEARRHSPREKNALRLPSAESVSLCDDKFAFNKALIKAGFGQYIPRVTQGPGLTPPYILKKRTGVWGKECYIIRDHDDENAQLCRINDEQYFCQELVPGCGEFATHILFVDGEIVKALNIRYGFASDTPIKGQDTPYLNAVHRSEHLDLFARVLRTIEFEGLCCVNYKVARGEPLLLEINPRFGGSLAPYFFSFIRHMR
jgi:predicted ATP-grasp superfamily ATP-dependent carboligase